MRYGHIYLDGWQGVTKQRVEIVSETAKRYRIRALTMTKLAGRSRWLAPGLDTLVPKRAVVPEDVSPPSTTTNPL